MEVAVGKTLNSVIIAEDSNNIVIVNEQNTIDITAPGPQGAIGPVCNFDAGVLYLKANTIPTPIATINGRAVVSGNTVTGTLANFTKDASTNSLRYDGAGGRFHAIATFSFYAGSQDTCGFYIGANRSIFSPLDADADRISESEIYTNAGSSSNQPQSGTIQTLVQLNNNDRIFFIVQNKNKAGPIQVEFMKLIVRA